MMFRVVAPWPVGQWLVPSGEVLDTNSWTYNGTPLPTALPSGLRPLDDDAARELYVDRLCDTQDLIDRKELERKLRK